MPFFTRKTVTCLSASMDGQFIISGGKDSLVKVWHISSRKCVRSFEFKGELVKETFSYSIFFQRKSFKTMVQYKSIGLNGTSESSFSASVLFYFNQSV